MNQKYKRWYSEDEYLQLSALQHYLFCKRQCALIHIDGQWSDNVLTAEGTLMHRRAHETHRESRGSVRREYSVPVRSAILGLSGLADVVEFVESGGCEESGGDRTGQAITPFPVEYKRGRPKKNDCDRIQLCAQALCLEEMLDVSVENGALFYGKTRRRQDVRFDDGLRNKTVATAKELHAFVQAQMLPPPEYRTHCKSCSFNGMCLPKPLSARRTVTRYLKEAIQVQ